METSKFFRFIWRANGILILLTFAALFMLLVYSIFETSESNIGLEGRAEIANETLKGEGKEALSFGNLEEIAGSDFLMVPLYLDQEYDRSYSSTNPSSVRNYVFINGRNSSAHWLIPHNRYYFFNAFQFGKGDVSNAEPIDVKGIMYLLIKDDTNNDGFLTPSDKLTISFSNPSGLNYMEVIDNVSEYLGYQYLDDSTVLVMYVQGDKTYTSKISIPDNNILLTKELPVL